MKREVMLTAWRIYREGFGTFSASLKKAWDLIKKLYKSIKQTSLTQEEANKLMENKSFRHTANHSNFSKNMNYNGERKVSYKYNFWMNYGKIRFYINSFVDGIEYRNTYID